MKKVNSAKKNYTQLQKEGKVEYLDSEKEQKEMKKFNDFLSYSKRQFVIKNAQSIQSAKNAILTH